MEGDDVAGTDADRPETARQRRHLGEEVFAFGLADERSWTRDTALTDIGFNWYANRFVKFSFDWQHAAFGSPVLINQARGLLRRDNDLFWIRCQVWF